MNLKSVTAFLVYPQKGADSTQPSTGNEIPRGNRVYRVIEDIFDTSETQCHLTISFNNRVDGRQQNPCRDLITTYIEKPDLSNGKTLADRLSGVTTKRSGLGLLFLALGSGANQNDNKLVVSRFPADQGIVANTTSGTLTVEFIDDVFMRNSAAYKAVLYKGRNLKRGFWEGLAVDKQINGSDIETSRYWVRDFLDSDFKTTSVEGTRRLAVALRDASRDATNSIEVRQELVSAAIMAPGLDGQTISANDFATRFALSEGAKNALQKQFKYPKLAAEKFTLNSFEFRNQIQLKSITLDNEATMTAPAERFSDIFKVSAPDGNAEHTEYRTIGRILHEKLQKR